MSLSRQTLWDDQHFTVQVGAIVGPHSVPATDLGAGLIYYPGDVNLTHHLGGTNLMAAPLSPTGLHMLWSTGTAFETVTISEASCSFIRVELKPPPRLVAELPDDFLGLASAALLQDDWAEPFKSSVREDLDTIRAFIEPLSVGDALASGSLERAVLAKQDLDLKLLWSAREYRNRGVFGQDAQVFAYSTRLAAVTPANGMINVTVNTKDAANTAVSGCVVWYVTRINHANPGFYKSFSRFSTPTSESLAVGNYEMWTEKGGTTGPRRPISISSAATKQFVDLWAP